MTRIEMFTGKGGVGKATMSVATALKHARSGKTLLISTDPSGSLSEIFSQPLDQRVTEVAANLDAVELTRHLVLDLWRTRMLQSADSQRVIKIPELSGEQMVDGFLGEVSELLRRS